MGKPVVNEPHYPVINASPTWGAIIRNWSLGDYAQLITYTVAGGIVGFAGGALLVSKLTLVATGEGGEQQQLSSSSSSIRLVVHCSEDADAPCTEECCPRVRNDLHAPESLRPCCCATGKPVRRQGSIYLAGIGAFLSITASCRGSFYRLRGIWENQGECAARGIPFPATN